jgi:hypothetical protein
MREPTSWFAIEPGWDVEDAGATFVGEVTAVIGDRDADIFDGLRFETADGEERFAAAESVGAIVEGRVSLTVQLDDLEPAPAEEEPGGVEIRPDPPGQV